MARDVSETHNKYLRDPKFAARFLNDARKEGDATDILIAIRSIAEARKDEIRVSAVETDEVKSVRDTTIPFKKILNEGLRDPEVAAAYLCEALEEGNEAEIRMSLQDIAEAQKDEVN